MKRFSHHSMYLIFLMVACSPSEDTTNQDGLANNSDTIVLADSVQPDGFQLLQASCFSCHDPNPEAGSIAAPNLAELKKVYLQKYPQEVDFSNALQRFLLDPSADKAIVDGAVLRYGIMPKISLQTDQLQAIATYLFVHSVEEPTWFTVEFPEEVRRVKLSQGQLSFLDRGFEYAMATKSVLGKNLKEKINAAGTLAAVEFCNLKALHFTDSMSTVYNAEIKRVTDQPRNKNNRANATELTILNEFKNQLANGEIITPQTIEEEAVVYGYYPIETNEMCLKCHGPVETIEKETWQRLKALYPTDEATGYSTNQLRGMWVVKMMK